MARPRLARLSPEPGGGVASASSVIVFHSPQDAHFPVYRAETAPQFWQTKLAFCALANPYVPSA